MEISPQLPCQNSLSTRQYLLEFVNIIERTKDIIKFINGGIVVCTPPIAGEEKVLLKTLIQPDGDVITHFNKSALDDIRENHHKIQEHFHKVSLRLCTIYVALKIIHLGKYLYIPVILGSIYNYYLNHLIKFMALSILSLFLWAIRLVVQQLFLVVIKYHAKKLSQGLLPTAR